MQWGLENEIAFPIITENSNFSVKLTEEIFLLEEQFSSSSDDLYEHEAIIR
jgi:hypothetical protein